jgi:saxitoxin biosynthesis operon SxtJ-like protein
MAAYEDFHRDEDVNPSSNRTFGMVLAAFFALIGVLPLLRGHSLRVWALPLSAIFLLAGLVAPAILTPLNRLWTALGTLLHKITNPIILGVFFYAIFMPFGSLMRLFGKDFLRSKLEPDADSYWIVREPAGPPPESMSNQF